MSGLDVGANTSDLITPYGGRLVNILVDPDHRHEILNHASRLLSLQLMPRGLCDLEMIASGGFSPLDRFMGQADYERVLEEMRLADGRLFPIPITLPVDGAAITIGKEVALRSPNNDLLAVMLVEEVYDWDLKREAHQVYGTTDSHHPLVAEMHTWPKTFVSGPLQVFSLPKHYDFVELRRTPAEVRCLLAGMGHSNVVAFQTRNPIHRAHEELTKTAARSVGGSLLIHPVVGLTKPGDIDHFTRVRAYKILVEKYYNKNQTLLSLLPLAMRMAGPREVLWHAIIRRNYGANHFIVGRDHAGPGHDSKGRPFYGPYDSQERLLQYESEIGVKMVPFKELVYLLDEDRYEESDRVPPGSKIASISGTQVRVNYLGNGKKLPEWFTRPETSVILSRVSPPNHKEGILRLAYRAWRRRQISHRRHSCRFIDGIWASGNFTRWRRSTHPLVQGARVQQRTSGYEYSPHRICRFGDRASQRRGDLRRR